MKDAQAAPGSPNQDPLRRFLHDLSGPLSAVALQLESANRAVARGQDPSQPLAVARQELEKAFGVFERGRDALLREPEVRPKEPRP